VSLGRATRPAALAALALLACLPAAAGEAPTALELYKEFEALNTPVNLDRGFINGQPPEFVIRQVELLRAIAARPAAEAVPILLRITTEHLERVEGLPEAKLLRSPLQVIQTPLVDALSRHSGDRDVRDTLARLAHNPAIKEYARGRALDTLAGHLVAEVDAAGDPAGRKRAAVLLETMIGGLALSDVFHTPGRLRALARRAATLVEDPPQAPWLALAAAADTKAKRYAADAALALACARKEGTGKPVAPAEKDLLVEACARWLKEFRPAAAKEKYPSDLLGESLVRLGARLDYAPLAGPLRRAGLLPPE